MSDLTLSQDEIDALLVGSPSDAGPSGGAAPGGSSFPEAVLNAFSDILGQLVGPQSANLSGMISGEGITISPPTVTAVTKDQVQSQLPEEVVEIKVDFTEGLAGEHSYLLKGEDALKIAGPMVGQEGLELNDAAIAAVGEAASLLAGSAVTSFSDTSKKNISPTPPEGRKVPKAMVSLPDGPIVQAVYQLQLGSESLQLIETFDGNFVQELTAASMPADQAMGGMGMQQPMGGMQAPMGGMQQMGMPQQPMGGMQQMGMQQAMPGMMGMQQAMPGMMGMQQPTNIQGVQFPTLAPQGFAGESGNIGLLMDVFMEVTVELGRAKRLIKDILGMGEGTIIALDKLAGEPVDILVNHKLIAKGEVVVIDENFGVRVTEIVNQVEKMSGSM